MPWGVPTAERSGRPLYTRLNAWLFRLGIDVVHGRPYHPQTQGKAERFHRSFEAEVLRSEGFQDLSECQPSFQQWRSVYNCERPHEALTAADGAMTMPASRYRPSGRLFPEELPPIAYGPADQVRTVAASGVISFQGERHYIGEAFAGEPVAVRPNNEEKAQTEKAQTWAVYYCHKKVRVIDLNNHQC